MALQAVWTWRVLYVLLEHRVIDLYTPVSLLISLLDNNLAVDLGDFNNQDAPEEGMGFFLGIWGYWGSQI
jgi:hypothetical protein